ncbi:MAG: type II secretion system secretin GspD [Deltaproteobacteria bacterium]|nr:type II secretion system secretin GspD [Deltaproteobacteria bacterium]
MSTESQPQNPVPRSAAVYLWASALLAATVCATPGAAAAQDGEEQAKPRLPLKQSSPFMKGRSLSIPGKLPTLKSNAAPAPASASAPRILKPEATKPRPAAPAKPAPVAQPAPGGDDDGPSFADLKKAGGKKCKPLPPTARVNFDFKGDIQELVETISETTCKNFILTNKVRSQKFEIVSPSPITVEEAWRAFLSALEANDFTLIRVGRYYKIIQATDGTRAPVPMYDGLDKTPVNDAMVTTIWKLKHGGDVNAVVNYLNIFKSGKGQIHPFQGTSTIIATDFGTSIERLERILKEIDQPGALEEVHVVEVQFATATEIADKLTQIFEPQKAAPGQARQASRITVKGRAAAKPAANEGGGGSGPEDLAVSKILADDRTNKLIIISSDDAFKQMLELMRELDVPEDTTDGQIHVLRLKHADAEEMASTLSNLAQGKAASPRPARGAAKTPAAPGAAATSAQLFQGEVKITSDKPTNSLVITASKTDLASVKRVVEKLDIPRYQVFVEAVIMEVATSRNTNVGTGWHGAVGPTIGGELSPIVFGNTPNSDLSSLIKASNPAGLATLLGLAGAFRGPVVPGSESIVSGGIPAVGVVIQALQSTNDVNVVSSPHLLTMDNEEAEIQVNEKRPFPSGLTLGGLGGLGSALGSNSAASGALGNLGGLGLGSVSFNREDVGLTLKLKPQINDEDYVKLEIDQELSDVAGTDQVTNQVITSKRSAKTTVVVRSQDSVIIGGLVRDRETLNEAKTPLLGDIPLLGWLFKRREKKVEKVNLILVLTPYIIRGPDDFRTIFERKMEERKEFVNRFYGTTKEYRAAIDWRRKQGPLSLFNEKISKEMKKAENEGPGQPDETIIRADEPEVGLPPGDGEPTPADPEGATPDIPATPADDGEE